MNQDIITALKNGIEKGEDLKTTMQILINSGYNSQEVEEASRYVSSGVLSSLKINPDEELIMPEKKGWFGMKRKKQIPPIPINPYSQIKNESQQIKKVITNKNTIPSKKIYPTLQISSKKKKKLWIKEILLLFILLMLLGVLVGTIFFKDEIINFFS